MYAVAARDGNDLFLVLRIRRSSKGEIFTLIPTGRSGDEWKKWNPHASFHADGQYHHKSFDRKMLVKKAQRPDLAFTGTMNLLQIPVSADRVRNFGVPCDPAAFAEVFELNLGNMPSKDYTTHLAVDLSEPAGKPIITPGGTVLGQAVFKDAIPWILATWFDNVPGSS